MYQVPDSLQEFHRHYNDSVRWRLTADGLEVENSGIERTADEPLTATRVWEDYADLINQYASEYNVPAELILATVCTETGGDPNAVREEPGYVSDEATPHKVSPGLMQTLISTARGTLGPRGVAEATITRDWLFTATNSVNAGTSYIQDQHDVTSYDPVLVAAAYNAGNLFEQTGAANRFKLRQYPIGTSEHCDRFIEWFNDFWEVLRTHETRPTVSFYEYFHGGGFALPVDLGGGTKVNDENAEAYYNHTEREHAGGYFPIGANTVWHGGLHIHGERGTTMVHACAAGELVAARLFETDADDAGHGHYGSVNFILLKHRATAETLRNANRGDIIEYKVITEVLNFRDAPNGDKIGQLAENDVVEPREGEPEEKDGYTWLPLTVKQAADGALVGREGYCAYATEWLEERRDGEDHFADDEPRTYYSLYCHLNPETITADNDTLADVAWIRTNGEVGFKTTVPNLPLRDQPDEGLDFDMLAEGAECQVVSPAPAANGTGDHNWQYVKIVGGDAANAGKIGWIPANDGWVAPLAGSTLKQELVDKLKAGGVVQVSTADAPVNVKAGEPLWAMGEYGSPAYRAGLMHWEVFSSENLMPSWRRAIDGDANYNMDTRQILNLVEQDWWGDSDILTREEVERFYATNERAAALREWSCYFVSEWGINLDVAVPQLKNQWARWRTGVLKRRIEPFLWWDDAAGAGVELPERKKVWHYNPVAFVRALSTHSNGAAPGGPAAGNAVIIQRNGAHVPHFSQGDAQWGDETLGENQTISGAGCAMTSVAMVLAYYGRDITPLSLDNYLDDNNGYVGDNILWATALEAGAVAGGPTLTVDNHNFTDAAQFADTLNERIDANLPTIAQVDYDDDADVVGDHFVVIVGRTEDGEFIMNDPATAAGDGSSDPSDDNIIERTSRHTGMQIVRLMLFDVAE